MAEKQNTSHLSRIVFDDKGVEKGYHRVDFAYACDKKTFGVDTPMANPYLMTSRRKDASGKYESVHSYFLSNTLYDRLMEHANKDGMSKESRWSGVIDAKVGYVTARNGKQKVSVDLTDGALARGEIQKPKDAFDEKAHDNFVVSSLKERRLHRENQMNQVLGHVSEPTQVKDTQLGE